MPVNIVEKFRHRSDKMTVRETFPESGRVIERFDAGRADKLRQHEYFRDKLHSFALNWWEWLRLRKLENREFVQDG